MPTRNRLEAAAHQVVEFFNPRAKYYDREYHDATPGGYDLRIRRRKLEEGAWSKPDRMAAGLIIKARKI